MMHHYSSDQTSAISKLNKVKCGALFMEAGTGKTRSAMELIKNTDADYIIWFTPYQTKDNLRKELDKWGGLECDIVGIESISNSSRIFLSYYNKCDNASKPFIVVDESLKIKNGTANRTKRMLRLSKLAEYRLILNGTPLSKNLLDLYSQMEFLSPKILKMTESQFKNNFCEYVQINYHTKGFGRTYTKEFIKKYHNIDYLYELIEPFIFESKLSLSVGQQHHDIAYSLSDDEVEQHNYLKDKYLSDEVLLAMNNNIFLSITQKMQHNYSLSQEKFAIVDKLLEGRDRSKVLIFAKYIDTQEKLRKYYSDLKIMSLQKHSYGLNLQNYNTIIFWDKTWDYAIREQSEHRIYRTGQTYDCTYYDLTANVGLDRLINLNIEKKSNMLNIFKEKTAQELRDML